MAKKTGRSRNSGGKVVVKAVQGETEGAAYARAILSPDISALYALQGFGKKCDDTLTLADLAGALEAQIKAAQSGELGRSEGMLMVQAHTLDAIFNDLARRAALNLQEHLGAGETYLRLALKAQSQCRATLETLAEIKNPRPVAFVKQANIANGPQQVNNGSRARENESTPNKLLERDNGERMDTGTSGAAGRGDQAVEAVGAIDRSEDGRG